MVRKALISTIVGMVAVFATFAGVAYATLTVTVSNAGAITMSVTGLTETTPSIGIPITCNYTLTGTINGGTYAIPLPGQVTIGAITGGTGAGCNLGVTKAMLVSPTNPWPVVMRSSEVLSPRYAWRIVGFSLLHTSTLLGFRCLYRGDIGFWYTNQVSGTGNIAAGSGVLVSAGAALDTCPSGLPYTLGSETWPVVSSSGRISIRG